MLLPEESLTLPDILVDDLALMNHNAAEPILHLPLRIFSVKLTEHGVAVPLPPSAFLEDKFPVL